MFVFELFDYKTRKVNINDIIFFMQLVCKYSITFQFMFELTFQFISELTNVTEK